MVGVPAKWRCHTDFVSYFPLRKEEILHYFGTFSNDPFHEFCSIHIKTVKIFMQFNENSWKCSYEKGPLENDPIKMRNFFGKNEKMLKITENSWKFMNFFFTKVGSCFDNKILTNFQEYFKKLFSTHMKVGEIFSKVGSDFDSCYND